jgi:acetoin utilization deacetylase AcuC-like enzyme
MFIYNKDTQLNLIEYGIEIPLLGKRGKLLFEFIKDNFSTEKIIQTKLENCSKENLLFAHSNEFIERLLTNPEQDLLTAFELIAEDGSFNRYNPKLATSSLDNLVQRILKQVSGTILTCELALKNNFAFHIGGGLHHAMTNTGRGFCLVNDIIIAAKFMQNKYNLKNILVIDIDAHKGDGTAQMTKADDSITTFSIHMKDNWPMDMGNPDEPWFIPSDVDIPVTNDDDYIEKLKLGLKNLKDFPAPDLCIVVQGSDPYEHDELESSNQINLSLEQMLARDKLIYNYLKDRLIPQAYVMAGGYGTRAHEPYIEFLKYLKTISS